MQRTCFALAMLLGWMASSVLVVGKTSQTRVEAVTWLPGPGSVCGTDAGRSNPSVVLGQSVEGEHDGWSEEIGSADQVASDLTSTRDESELLATSEVGGLETDSVVRNGWWEIQGTGYDAAYDFAMHEGRYFEDTLSQRDIDHWLSTAGEAAHDLDAAYTVSGLSSSIGCEDLDELFGSEVRATDGEWLAAKLQLTQEWASSQLRPMWSATTESTWMTGLRDRWVEYQAATVDAQSVHTPVATEDCQEEVLLITAAETLDRLGLRLQEAAQLLRTWAADRVVSKSGSRRVARNVDTQGTDSRE